MPEYDARQVFALRQTDLTYDLLLRTGWGHYLHSVNGSCVDLSDYSEEELRKVLNVTIEDDLGNGVIHKRTQKFFISFENELYSIRNYVLKNRRKPTDMFLISNGLCFSVCSGFIISALETGSAVVAGIGVTNPGDELFVASEFPSGVIELNKVYPERMNNSFGITTTVTYSESYPNSLGKTEIIPRDYTLNTIDLHLGYYLFDYEGFELDGYLQNAQMFLVNSCNPNNVRLVNVTNNCSSSDPHAKNVGYVCGQNGHWDTSRCVISSCDEGFYVDYESNSCVPDTCYPSSSVASKCSLSLSLTLVILLCVLLW